MRCCLIIATLGRDVPLARLFASLAQQRHGDFRVVLVDQNNDGRLDAIIAEFTGRLAIEHLRVAPCGVSAARNAGLARLGDAELVAFPDDDCFFDPLTLAQAVAILQKRPEVGVVMGSLQLPEASQPSAEAAIDARTSRPLTRQRLLRASNTFTMFFRRGVVDGIGAFDESFGPGTASP